MNGRFVLTNRYCQLLVLVIALCCLAGSVAAADRICARCKQPITTGTYIEASGKFYHTKHFTCTRCGQPIGTSTYQFHNGEVYDSACYVQLFNPRCSYCGKIITGKYIEVELRKYHDTCYLEHVADRCAICGKPIQGAYLYDSYGNKVHADHLDEAKICAYCSRLLSPTSKGGVTYPDGRVVCGLCLQTVVSGKKEADSLLRLTIGLMGQEGIAIGMKKLPMEIVSRKKMATLGSHGEKNMQGFTKFRQTEQFFGLVKENDVKVYILEGLPRMAFVATVAHELMHVWLGINSRFDTRPQLAEGSCNYAAYLVLRHFPDESKPAIAGLMKDDDPIYGEGFRKAKTYAESVGVMAWLEYLKTHDQPPW